MKTLHIHVGMAKTATTSLQFFCKENAGVLAEKGFCYPVFPFSYPGIAPGHNGRFLLEAPENEEEQKSREEGKGNFAEGMRIVNELFLTYDDIIVSDESIWRAIDIENKNLLNVMRREAEQGGFQIHIIVYLRRQDKYFLSHWNQQTKRLTMEETFEEYENRVSRIRLDYYAKLQRIAEVFGKENITVRRFEKESFKGGSIYSDFLSIFDLELTDEYQISQAVRNTGLAGNMHEIKRVLNGLPQMNDRKQHRYMLDILQECSKTSGEKYPNEMWSKDEIAAFLEEYQPGNRKVAEEYLHEPGSELFDDTIADLPKWEKENPYMMDDLIRIFGVAVLRLHQENLDLKQRLRQQSENVNLSFYKIKHPFRTIFQKIKKKLGFEK